MKQGQRAGLGVRGQIVAQPRLLGRANSAATRHVRAFTVESDDVPGSQIDAVVALRRVSRHRAKVIEVPGGVQAIVVMAADDGNGAKLGAPPRGVVGPREVAVRRVTVSVVAVGKHGSRGVGIEERRRGKGARQVEAESVRDVAGPNQDHIRGLRSHISTRPAQGGDEYGQSRREPQDAL